MIEPPTFVVCLEVGDYPVSLECWKVYRVLPDADAERHEQLRVVDETGEDYVYPQAWFAPVQLPADLARRLQSQQPAIAEVAAGNLLGAGESDQAWAAKG